VTQEPKGFVAAIALIAGPLAVLILLVDETDEAWADLYSTAVSLQNIFPRTSQRGLIVGLGLLTFVVATLLDITQYEGFLLLIGSIFVPLFGCVAVDYFLVRRRAYEVGELYRVGGAYWYRGGVSWIGLVAWGVGVFAYRWIAQGLPWIGASVPSFVVAGLIYLFLARLVGRGRQSAVRAW
jgi:purine-cytosine permease-like protein